MDQYLLYEGDFIDGEYNSKGTAYKEDGSVEYQGKWKNRDYST